ncbi:MAG: gluconate 2-dehydrogenase subunit 3 family protein, partial [Bacteroidota bacterium]
MLSRRAALKQLTWLGGATITAPIWSSIVTACKQAGPSYQSNVLSGDQFKLLTQLVDLVIPETDTPGGVAAGVPTFID